MSRLLVLLFVLVMISQASAVTIDLQVPSKIIYGKQPGIFVGCSDPSSASAKILSSGNVVMTFSPASSNTTFTMPSLNPGDYEVSGTCEGSGGNVTATTPFKVARYDLSISSFSPSSIYTDSNVTLYVTLNEVSSSTNTITANHIPSASWKVSSGSQQLSSQSVYQNGRWEITSSGFSEGQGVKVAVSLDALGLPGEEVSASPSFPVSPVLSLSMSVSELKPSQNAAITAVLTHHGSVVPLKDAKLTLTLDGSSSSIIDATDKDVVFTAPGGSSHTVRLKAVYGGREAIAEKTAYYIYSFSGRMENADGKALPARFVFTGPSSFTSEVNGDYGIAAKAGTYDVLVEGLPGLKRAVFKGVKIDGNVDGTLRFDSFDPSEEHIDAAGAIAIEFGLPFSKAEVEASYDSRKVADEGKIMVYACHSWNLAARSCVGEWTEEDSTVDTIRDTVKFAVEDLSAFIIGVPSTLSLEGRPPQDEYYANEPIEMVGIVKNSKGTGIDGVSVEYSLTDTDGTVKTNKDGIFRLSLTAPTSEGQQTLRLRAHGEGFGESELSIPLTISLRKELGLFFSLAYSVEPFEPGNISFAVSNTGDADLNNIRINVDGLPAGSSYAPKELKILKKGERKDVRVSLPAASAGDYKASVTVDSDEVSKKDAFVISYKPPASSPPPGEGFSLPSGLSLSSPFSQSLTSLLAGAALILLAEKFRRRRPEKRNDAINILKSINEEVQKGYEGGQLKCECGKMFTTKRAFGIHRAKSHKSR